MGTNSSKAPTLCTWSENLPSKTESLNSPNTKLPLPTEIFIEIFSHFYLKDLLTFSLVCKHFYNICSLDRFWKPVFLRDIIPQKYEDIDLKKLSWKQAYLQLIKKNSWKQFLEYFECQPAKFEYLSRSHSRMIVFVGDGKSILLSSNKLKQTILHFKQLFYSAGIVAIDKNQRTKKYIFSAHILDLVDYNNAVFMKQNVDVVWIGIDLMNQKSWNNAVQIHLPWARKFLKDRPIIMIGVNGKSVQRTVKLEVVTEFCLKHKLNYLEVDHIDLCLVVTPFPPDFYSDGFELNQL